MVATPVQPLPRAVVRQLADLSQGSSSTTAVMYGIGLLTTAALFYSTTGDVWLTAFPLALAFLTPIRVGVNILFRRCPDVRGGRYGWLFLPLLILGCCYSLLEAALLIRSYMLGNMLCVAVAGIVLASYLPGVMIRASAVPQLAVPHLLCVFVPPIAAALFSGAPGLWVVAGLLTMFCAGSIGLGFDVHDRIRRQLLAEYHLAQMAFTDFLTKLANRAGFERHADALFGSTAAGQHPVALAAIDLDGFKAVNDTLGHAAGDALLVDVAARITNVLGPRHFAARMGGDEFNVAFADGTTPEEATALAKAIVDVLGKPFQIAGVPVVISACLGLAFADAPDDTLKTVMRRADSALYEAKRSGKN